MTLSTSLQPGEFQFALSELVKFAAEITENSTQERVRGNAVDTWTSVAVAFVFPFGTGLFSTPRDWVGGQAVTPALPQRWHVNQADLSGSLLPSLSPRSLVHRWTRRGPIRVTVGNSHG